jgi:hypothetical protein
MSDSPLRDAIEDAKKLPRNEGQFGAVVEDGGNVGVQGHVAKNFGKGWSFGAAGEYMRKTGYKAAAFFGWKG